jgi:serine protease AprX
MTFPRVPFRYRAGVLGGRQVNDTDVFGGQRMFPALRWITHRTRTLTTGLVAGALVVPAAMNGPAAAARPQLVSYVAVAAAPSTTSALSTALAAAGGHVTAQFPLADAVVVELPRHADAPTGVTLLPDLALRVAETNASLSGPGETVRQTIAVPDRVNGSGVTVALLDTGVYDAIDLAGRVTHVNMNGADAGDGYGHGTFLAGLIAGNGAASGGAYAGIAPAAKVLDIKVASADGSTSLSRVLAGLQQVASWHAADPSVQVLNLSLSSGTSLPPQLDPLAHALDALWRSGITVVVAAGNAGPAAGSVTSPGDDPTVLTVGALDENGTSSRNDDTVADFSSRGPTFEGDAKPALVAPGSHLISLRDPGSMIDSQNASARVGDAYFRGSGTSMSAAVVSGAVADLLSARPGLRPDDVKNLLTGSAYGASGLSDSIAAGSGGLDLGAALAAPVQPGHGRSGSNTDHAKPTTPTSSAGGPSEADSARWASLAVAWQQGDFASAARAWASLSTATQIWAAGAWAMTLSSDAALSNDPQLQARAWAARAWATDGWLARAWAARAWASTDWAARAWSARAWSARAWSARAWSAAEWSARAWSVSTWASNDWSANAWLSDAWGN